MSLDFQALRAPLFFAAKNDFKNLARVKDLGRTLLLAAEGLSLPQAFLALAQKLDTEPIESKKQIVAQLLAFIENGPSIPVPTPIVCPTPVVAPTPIVTRATPLSTPKDPYQPLTVLRGVGEKVAVSLAERHLFSITDLLFFLPRRYEDRRLKTSVRDAPVGERVTIVAEIRALGAIATRQGKRMFEMALADDTGILRLKWFRYNQAQFKASFEAGMMLRVSGVVEAYNGQKQMLHPDIQVLRDDEQADETPGIVPQYLDVVGVHQKKLRTIVAHALEYADAFGDLVPATFLPRALPSLAESLRVLHQPSADQFRPGAFSFDDRTPWHERLIIEEFFVLQVGLVRRRLEQSFEPGLSVVPPRDAPLAASAFPFRLTRAQTRVSADIDKDLASGRPMHRLVQGDVGSGKTAVAFMAALNTVRAGHQVALMAPTEILAEQHFKNATKVLHPQNVRLGFLSSSVPAAEAKRTLAEVKHGAIDLLIGTHALIQDRVEFSSLALAIIDEQHRFGVVQRAKLRSKGPGGVAPHLLVMTATPIPRTLALTVYGDLDVSIIDELPPGRTPITTELVRETQRTKLYSRVREQLVKGRQAYVVYPLIEESEKIDLKNATDAQVQLQAEFPEHVVDLLHGKMNTADKDRIMSRFAAQQSHILVSTTVIEVGIDVPNATMMVVEHADRFGLSQLHQLRGRVGRGAHQSFCFLVSGFVSEEAYHRLSVLTSTSDGFKVAEEDLAIRGPGEFIGTKQSGLPELGVANLARDQDLLIEAKNAAEAILQSDPGLVKHHALAKAVETRFAQAAQLTLSG